MAGRGRGTAGALLLVAFAVALLTGCAPDESVHVRDWMLEADGVPTHAVRVPADLTAQLPPRPGTYVLRTVVTLPPEMRGQQLTLTFMKVYTSPLLRVAGETLEPLESGPFSRSPSNVHEATFRIPARDIVDADLPLEVQLPYEDTFATRVGGVRLGRDPYGDPSTRVYYAVDAASGCAALAIMVVLMVASLASFALDRRRTAHGWFGLLTAGLVGWHLAYLGVAQLLMERDIIRIPVAATAIICVAGISFVRAHFGLHGLPRVTLAVIVALGVVALAIGWRPFSPWPISATLSDASVVLTLGYMLWTLGKLARRGDRRRDAAWMLGSWLLVGGAALVSPILLVPVRTTPPAWIVFVVIHAVLLVRTQTRALGERVVQLEDRNREVAVLNDELRRQVGDRSARLAEALSRIGRLPEASRTLATGALLNDRYRVVRPLGSGAMGEVYEVERTTDGRHLALKTLTRPHSGASLARLAREAEVAAKVRHPNVVGIVDIDVDPSGTMFLVEDLVRGHPLSEERQRYGDVAWAERMLGQIAAGLGAIHAAGVVHRDLKPANVLLEVVEGAEPMAKIADFGLARLAGSTAPVTGVDVDPVGTTHAQQAIGPGVSPAALTMTGAILGTPLYMAPEVARQGAREAPMASDMWSFGVMAYQLTTGRLPFESPPLVGVADSGDWSMPPIDTEGLPRPLADLVARCLAMDPDARPTAQQAAEALGVAISVRS
jgi:serine/threonine-protein kinase